MIMGIVPIFTFVCLDVFMSQLSMRSRRLRNLFSGEARIIISDGKIDQQAMHELRYTVDDLLESLRGSSVFELSEVQLAVVETTGKISVMKKQPQDNPTRQDLNIKSQAADPSVTVISDGEISDKALSFIGRDRKWLSSVTAAAGLSTKEVFIMTADSSGKYEIIRKEPFN